MGKYKIKVISHFILTTFEIRKTQFHQINLTILELLRECITMSDSYENFFGMTDFQELSLPKFVCGLLIFGKGITERYSRYFRGKKLYRLDKRSRQMNNVMHSTYELAIIDNIFGSLRNKIYTSNVQASITGENCSENQSIIS